MVKKIRRIRTVAKTAPKTKEKKLIENAKKLAGNPFIILPEYEDARAEKFVNKTRKKIEKVWKNRGDVKKLKKLANKKGLEGAVAGTLMLSHSKKATYLASMRVGNRDVMYALRGKAKKELLVAVQHFDDPVLRLLGFRDLAVKNKVCLYSWGNRFVCSEENKEPLDEFKNFIFSKMELKNRNGVASCPHLDEKKLRDGKPDEKDYLRINWKNANVVIGVCSSCTYKNSKNTLFELSKYFIDPNINNNVSVNVVSKLPELQGEIKYLSEYLSGKITDNQLITRSLEEWKDVLKSSEKKVFIADGVSYGDNVKRFIDALKPNEYERKGLEFILTKVDEPVLIEDATPNKLLEKYWKKYGKELILSIVKDDELTDTLLSVDESPSKIIETAVKTLERKKKLTEYPNYKKLPPTAKFVDEIIKNYLLFGEQKALSLLSKPPEETKMKSIAFAFLLAFGRGEERKWQYSEVEIEYGRFLKEYVKKLMNASPKEYDKTLKELILASGTNEKI